MYGNCFSIKLKNPKPRRLHPGNNILWSVPLFINEVYACVALLLHLYIFFVMFILLHI